MNNFSKSSKPAFFGHNLENEREKKVVTRSSAVFYFIEQEDVTTEIHFMNYWREKRDTDVTLIISLRDMMGFCFHKQTIPIDRQGGYVLKVSEILENFKKADYSQGSIEIEFLSKKDIAIAYPAAVVRYVGKKWHTAAHTSQRYFSKDSGDDDSNIDTICEIEEGNLTISSDKRIEPFLIIHNGQKAVESHKPIITIFSSDGKDTIIECEAWSWAPYQTRFVRLSELCDFKSILGNKAGSYSIKTLIGGVFPRLIGGNILKNQFSIDHTNFAATDGPAASDVFPSKGDPNFKELVFNLPNNIADNWRCYIDLYPTYPSSDYIINKSLIDQKGDIVESEKVCIAKDGEKKLDRIEMDNKLAKNSNLELSIHHNVDLPRRFHMGIHYQVADGLPGFLTDGPIPYTTNPIKTRWFPIFDVSNCKNYLMLANRFMASEQPQRVNYELKLFNCSGENPIITQITLNPYESKCVFIHEIFPDLGTYLSGNSGWIYLRSNLPQRSVCHYASLMGSNSIAVDHVF